jgi:hypothetical protein
MPPRGVTSAKRKRQYEHVKESELERGVGEDRAEEIAARTVNKQRAQSGETKAARRGRKASGAKKASGGKKASGRKKSAGANKAAGARKTARKSPSARGRKAAAKKR